MDWNALGAVGDLVGSIGVIVSLVYLAVQIRQNSALIVQSTTVARADAYVTSANHGAEFMRALALDPETARIWMLGTSHPEELAEADLRRFDLLMLSQIILTDVNYGLMRVGTLDAEVYQIWDHILERWLRHTRFQRLWESGALERMVTASLAERIRQKLAELTGAETPPAS